MRCWNDTGEKDKNDNPVYGVYDRIWDDIVIDDSTPKTLDSEHFLCTKTARPEKMLEVKVSGFKEGKILLTLTPLDGREFYIYTQEGKPHATKPSFNKPVVARVNPDIPKDRKLMITAAVLENKFQRVMTLECDG